VKEKERERERKRIDWVWVSSLGMLGEKEWEKEWKDREGREEKGVRE
jgi:hypothetical protein